MSQKNNQKPILLYLIIAILSVALIAVSILTFLSMTTISTMRNKINTQQKSIADLSIEYDTVKSHAEDLELQKNNQDLLLAELEKQVRVLQATADAAAITTPAAPETPPETESQPQVLPEDTVLPVIMPQLQSMLPAGNGSWSVFVSNLAKNSTDSINSHSMQAASLIKLYIMGAVYENYNSLSSIYGSGTLDSLLRPMITVSDNDAANTLVTYLGSGDSSAGMAAVNNYCTSHGYMDTHMGRLLLHSNEYDDNYTSVTDCGRFLTEIHLAVSGQKTLDHAESMYELLKAQDRQHKIPAGLPAGVRAANKTGELADVENDAAIIYNTPSGEDLVICFMSENLSEPGSAQSSISNMTSFIYNNYN